MHHMRQLATNIKINIHVICCLSLNYQNTERIRICVYKFKTNAELNVAEHNSHCDITYKRLFFFLNNIKKTSMIKNLRDLQTALV